MMKNVLFFTFILVNLVVLTAFDKLITLVVMFVSVIVDLLSTPKVAKKMSSGDDIACLETTCRWTN